MHQYLTNRGLKPHVLILDNECPDVLKKYLRNNNVKFLLVPYPHVHHSNLAEHAIATFKDNIIAGLAILDPLFPMQLWCRLIPQAPTTFNLLRPLAINLKFSTKAVLSSAFDYNATPLAPPETRVIAYDTPSNRRPWVLHGKDGWYIGNNSEHYRCHKIYIPKTRAKYIARTVELFPHLYDMPANSSVDAAMEAARYLTTAL